MSIGCVSIAFVSIFNCVSIGAKTFEKRPKRPKRSRNVRETAETLKLGFSPRGLGFGFFGFGFFG